MNSIKENISDHDLMRYLVKYYRRSIITYMLDILHDDDMVSATKFLYYLIKEYNKFDVFPLKPDGIYDILSQTGGYEYMYTDRIDFLKYLHGVYQDQFDINEMVPRHVYARLKVNLIEYLILLQVGREFLKSILIEFKDRFKPISSSLDFKHIQGVDQQKKDLIVGYLKQIDINHSPLINYLIIAYYNNEMRTSLLYSCLKYTNFGIAKYLIDEVYKDEFEVEYICDALEQVLEDALESRGNDRSFEKWRKGNRKQNKRSLQRFEEHCINSICKTEQDKQIMKQCREQLWERCAKKINW